MIEQLIDAAWSELERQAQEGEMPYIDREGEVVDGAIDMRALTVAIVKALQTPTADMIRSGDAWQAHCGDCDSLYSTMIGVALHGPDCWSSEPTA